MRKIFYLLSILLLIIIVSCGQDNEKNCNHNYKITSIVESTCSLSGSKIEKCNKCQDIKISKLPTLDHAYETKTQTASCYREGKVYQECKVCFQTIDIEVYPKISHDYNFQEISPDCINEGYKLSICKICGYEEKTDFLSALGHDYSEWDIVKNPSEINDGIKERICNVCKNKEQVYISSKSYIDLTIIKEQFDSNNTYQINNYEELLLKYQVAILNNSLKLICRLSYNVDDLQQLINNLINDTTLIFDYHVTASLSNNQLCFDFSYLNQPNKSTNEVLYTQYDSLNYQPIVSSRGDSYDDFLINDSPYSFKVETTDQLFYVLERGVQPICTPNSNAEKAYNELKQILRNIIDDKMTNVEKIKSIHDYLIMNITYDAKLYNLLFQNPNDLKTYNGFYMDGVLFDKLAVCEGISKTVTALCNIEGIPCVTVDGYQTEFPTGARHAWNKVYVDNNWYILDVTSDGTIVNNKYEILSYQFFLIKEEDYVNKYTGETFKNINCNTFYNIYKNTYFTYNNQQYDFVITSQEELDVLVAYFNSNKNKNITIEFYISFNYEKSVEDAISKAYSNNKIMEGYSYINNEDIWMLLK